MALCIKTQILQQIETLIREVPAVNDVLRDPPKPIDRDTAGLPIAFIFDLSEAIVRRNRTARVTMPLHIEIWVSADQEELGDEVDDIAANIHMALLTSPEFKQQWNAEIVPDSESVTKFFGPEEGSGGIIMRYIVTFHHAWGNPYELAI